MVALGLLGRHQRLRGVGVAARADRRLEHHGALRRGRVRAQLLDELDRPAVDRVHGVGVVSEPGAPVGARAPGAAAEDEPRSARARELEERLVVGAERRATGLALEQREGREARELLTLVEDQRRLHPRVREEEGAVVEWEGIAVRHGANPNPAAASEPPDRTAPTRPYPCAMRALAVTLRRARRRAGRDRVHGEENLGATHAGSYPSVVRSVDCRFSWFIGTDESARYSCTADGYRLALRQRGQASSVTIVKQAEVMRVDAVVQMIARAPSHPSADPGIACLWDRRFGWLAEIGESRGTTSSRSASAPRSRRAALPPSARSRSGTTSS